MPVNYSYIYTRIYCDILCTLTLPTLKLFAVNHSYILHICRTYRDIVVLSYRDIIMWLHRDMGYGITDGVDDTEDPILRQVNTLSNTPKNTLIHARTHYQTLFHPPPPIHLLNTSSLIRWR